MSRPRCKCSTEEWLNDMMMKEGERGGEEEEQVMEYHRCSWVLLSSSLLLLASQRRGRHILRLSGRHGKDTLEVSQTLGRKLKLGYTGEEQPGCRTQSKERTSRNSLCAGDKLTVTMMGRFRPRAPSQSPCPPRLATECTAAVLSEVNDFHTVWELGSSSTRLASTHCRFHVDIGVGCVPNGNSDDLCVV
jgi:hypothetical protein